MSRVFSLIPVPGTSLFGTVGYAARFELTDGSEVFLMSPSAESLRQACARFGVQLDLFGAERVLMTSPQLLEQQR